MATRTFCDHCGNTVSFPTKYFYGTHNPNNYPQQGNGGLLGIPQQTLSVMAQAQASSIMHNVVTVDLCPHCVPIWVKRVEAITAKSDPE